MGTLTLADLRRALEELQAAADATAYLTPAGIDGLKRAIVTAVPVLRHGFDLPAELEARRGRLWADCETMLRIQDFLAVHPDQKIQQAADTMARNLERQARELKVQLRM
jgi:hypothetical protein